MRVMKKATAAWITRTILCESKSVRPFNATFLSSRSCWMAPRCRSRVSCQKNWKSFPSATGSMSVMSRSTMTLINWSGAYKGNWLRPTHVGATKMSVDDKRRKSNSVQTRKNVEGRLKRKKKGDAEKKSSKRKPAGSLRMKAADRKSSGRKRSNELRKSDAEKKPKPSAV